MEMGEFDESNSGIGSGIGRFPVYDSCDKDGRIIFCWKLGIWERLVLLFTGRIWHQVLLKGDELQECAVHVDKPDMTVKVGK